MRVMSQYQNVISVINCVKYGYVCVGTFTFLGDSHYTNLFCTIMWTFCTKTVLNSWRITEISGDSALDDSQEGVCLETDPVWSYFEPYNQTSLVGMSGKARVEMIQEQKNRNFYFSDEKQRYFPKLPLGQVFVTEFIISDHHPHLR